MRSLVMHSPAMHSLPMRSLPMRSLGMRSLVMRSLHMLYLGSQQWCLDMLPQWRLHMLHQLLSLTWSHMVFRHMVIITIIITIITMVWRLEQALLVLGLVRLVA
jgi:hypothetical protein